MSENAKGLTYEEAHAAKPVGYIFESLALVNTNPPAMEKRITLGERQNATDVNVYTEDVVNTLKGQISDLQEQLEGHKSAYENMRTRYEAERQRQFTEEGWFIPSSWVSGPAAESMAHLIERAKQASITNIVVSPGQPYEIKYEGDWIKYAYKVDPAAMPHGAAEQEFRRHLCTVLGLNVDEINDAQIITATMERATTEDRTTTLFDAIKHGDEAHQNWLKAAITAHFAGEFVPAVVMKAPDSNDDLSWVVKLGAACARFHEPIVINGLTIVRLDEMYKRLMNWVGMPDSRSLLGAFKQLVNEITSGSASLADIVHLATGDKTESQVFWSNTKSELTAEKAVEQIAVKLGVGEKRLGQQAGIAYMGSDNRLYMYNMDDTIARATERELYPVYFEEGKLPKELSPLHVTKEQVGLGGLGPIAPNVDLGEAMRVTPEMVGLKTERDCTSCPAQAMLEGCCQVGGAEPAPVFRAPPLPAQIQTGVQLNAYLEYEKALDAALDNWISAPFFKDNEYLVKVRAVLRQQYLDRWLKENVPAADNVKKFVINAMPKHIELGTKDNSAGLPKPVYSNDALNDPTNIQKATVMGMVGNEKQQQEAREFLTQYLAVNGLSRSAVDAYLAR